MIYQLGLAMAAISSSLRTLAIHLIQLHHHSVRLTALAAITALSIAACQSRTVPNQSLPLAPSTCHMVEHAMGETCVPNEAKRIIALYTPPLAALLALDIKPIGLAPVTGVTDEFPSYLEGKVEGIEIVGIDDEPNLEKIIQLKPDLILGWDHHEKAYPMLSQIAPTLLTQPNREASAWDDWKVYFRFVAESLGKQDIAQQVLDKYDQQIAQVKATIGNQYANKTISVTQVTEEYGIETYTKNSFSGSILSELNLQRPEFQDIVKPRGVIEAISSEQLELIDGDILFALSFSDADREMLDDLLKEPLWRTLKAVQNNQIYPVDGWTWVVANPLAAEVVLNDIRNALAGTP